MIVTRAGISHPSRVRICDMTAVVPITITIYYNGGFTMIDRLHNEKRKLKLIFSNDSFIHL